MCFSKKCHIFTKNVDLQLQQKGCGRGRGRSYMMIKYDQSYMIIIYDDHNTWSSYMAIISYPVRCARKAATVPTSIFEAVL